MKIKHRPRFQFSIAGAVVGLLALLLSQSSRGQEVASVSGTLLPSPTQLSLDGRGNLYFLDAYGDVLRVVASGNGPIATLPSVPHPKAGGVYTLLGEGANPTPAVSFSLNHAEGLAVDAEGNVFVSDSGNDRILAVSAGTMLPGLVEKPSAGSVYRVGGGSGSDEAGNNGPALAARLHHPAGLAADHAGNLYIADSGSEQIRVIFRGGNVAGLGADAVSGDIYALAGQYLHLCTAQRETACGDGGPASAALLNWPESVGVDAAGNIYIGESGGHSLRVVYRAGNARGLKNVETGSIYSVWLDASSGRPSGSKPLAHAIGQLAFDQAGDLFVADGSGKTIRKIDGGGHVYKVFGTTGSVCAAATDAYGDGCPPSSALLSHPVGLVVDATGDLLVGDPAEGCIRKLSVASSFVESLYLSATSEVAANTALKVSSRIKSNAQPAAGTIDSVAGSPTATGTFPANGSGGPALDFMLNSPAGLALDENANVYVGILSAIAGVYEGGTVSPLISEISSSPTQNYIYDVGGDVANTIAPGNGDGGPAHTAGLSAPQGIRSDASGNLYFADATAVLRIDAQTTDADVIAGSYSQSGYTGDGGPAVAATLLAPEGIALDGANNVFITDVSNNVVRMIYQGGTVPKILQEALTAQSLPAPTAGYIYTVVGGGTSAADNGISPITAQLSAPYGVFVDGNENVYVTDGGNYRVLRIDATTGLLTRIAGQYGVACSSGNCGDGGPATDATFAYPEDVAVDDASNVFISDYSASAIRKIDSSGTISLIAGTELSSGFSGDGGPATSALLGIPNYMTLDSAGNLYFTDDGNNDLRVIYGVATVYQPQTITFATIPTQTYGAKPVTLSATDTSGSAIVYKVDSGPATVTGSTLNLTGAGTVTVEADVAAGSGYAAASASQSFTVNTAVLTVTAGDLSRQYGQPNPTLTNDYSFSGFVDGDTQSSVVTGAPTLTTNCPSTTPSGQTCPIVVTQGTLSAGTNYTLVFVNGTLTIAGGEPQTITFPALPASVTYGVAPLPLGATSTSGLPITYAVSPPANAQVLGSSLSILAAGTFTITASQAGNSTYGAATPITQTISVNLAPLTVAASNLTRIQGIANPPLTYTISGFVNGDTQSSAVSGSPVLATTAAIDSPIADYPITITQGTLVAKNYNFTFVNGILRVIAAKPQTITFNALPNVTYGAGPISLTATSTSGLPISYSVTGPASLSGSTLRINGVGAILVSATQTGNDVYGAATAVTQTFSVSPAVLIVAGAHLTLGYGSFVLASYNTAQLYTMTGFVYSDTSAVVAGAPLITTTASSATAAGLTLPLNISQGTLIAQNYTFVFVNGSVTITGTQSLSVGANPTSLSIAQGHFVQTTIAVNPSEGWTGSVTLSCGTLPQNVTCVFSPATYTITTSKAPTSTLTVNTDSTVILQAQRKPGSRSTALAAAACWIGTLSVCFLFRSRWPEGKLRGFWSASLCVILMFGMIGLAACGSGGNSTVGLAQPGMSTVTVTATGTGSAATVSPNFITTVPVSIDITQ